MELSAREWKELLNGLAEFEDDVYRLAKEMQHSTVGIGSRPRNLRNLRNEIMSKPRFSLNDIEPGLNPKL